MSDMAMSRRCRVIKLFPLVLEHEAGITHYARFLRTQVSVRVARASDCNDTLSRLDC